MTCQCPCKCDNLLTIIDGATRCRQCFLGSHRPPELDDDEKEAVEFIAETLHQQFCGKVPGFRHLDLFSNHETTAVAVFKALKENA